METNKVMICETCNKVLDLRTTAFSMQYIHTLQDPDDHEPKPIPMPPGWKQGRCDFCNKQQIEYVLPVRDFTVPGFPHHTSAGAWAACESCGTFIVNGNWTEIENQAIRRMRQLTGGKLTSAEKEPIRKLYRAVRQNIAGPIRRI